MTAVLVVCTVVSILVAAACVRTLRRLRARNAVSRGTRRLAPLHWLVAPSSLAFLHRRLCRTVRAVRAFVPRPRRRAVPTAAQELADEIEHEAGVLDAELVATRVLPPGPRRHALQLLAPRVAELETLAVRLVGSPVLASGAPGPDALARIRQRLDDLQAAHEELARLERAAGLRAS